jgi:hypothetical protein
MSALRCAGTAPLAADAQGAAERSRQAIELARRHGWSEEPDAGAAYAVLGGAMVFQGRLAEAEPWLDHAERTLPAEARPAVDTGAWAVQAFLMEATARDAFGDPAAAGRALEHALDLAEPGGLLLPFLLHPAPGLLQRHARHRTAHAALITQILDLLTAPGKPRRPATRSARASRSPAARPASCATCRPGSPCQSSPANCTCR